MGKYLKLLRLEDQYLQMGAVLASAIFFQIDRTRVTWWLIATTCISIVGFIVNEVTDRHDTDKHSWNGVHMASWKGVHMGIVWAMGAIFSVVGLFISRELGVLTWAIVMYIFAIGYSAKPLRFKGVFGLDIISQLLVWWIIPFMALAWGQAATWWLLYLTVMAGGFLWSAFYPYQIADYDADKKADISPTHVVLGIIPSLRIGLLSGVIATLLYVLAPVLWTQWWMWPFCALLVICIWKYLKWMKQGAQSKTLKSLQQYVFLFKPFTQLLVVYLAVIYFFF